MTFQCFVLPDLRTLAAALRATPRRVRVGFLPARAAIATPSLQDPQRPKVFSPGLNVSARAA